MTAIRGNFANLLAPGIRKVLVEEQGQYPEEYSAIFNLDTSKRKYEEDQTVSGIGTMNSKSEGTGVEYFDPVQGYKTTYTHTTYGAGFRVTEEMYEDDLYAVMSKKMTWALTRAARNRYETQAGLVFDRAFSGSYVGADAVALCSASHPIPYTGGTQSNVLATAADLGVTSLQAAITMMEGTKGDDGLLINIRAARLVVPKETKFTARQMLGSEWEPGVTTNSINSVLDDDLSYFVWHYISVGSGAWFLLADKKETALNFFWRKKPAVSMSDDFDSGDAKVKLIQRFSVGWSDWKGVVGTPGA